MASKASVWQMQRRFQFSIKKELCKYENGLGQEGAALGGSELPVARVM